MAQFNADIQLNLQIEKALAGVKKVEDRLSKLSKLSLNPIAAGQKDIQQAARSYKVLETAFKGSVKAATNLGKTVAFVSKNFASLAVGLAGVEALNFANNFKALKSPLTQAASALMSTADAATEMAARVAAAAASAPTLTATIAAASVGLIAFGPQIATVTNRLLKFAKVAGLAKAPLRELFNTYNTFSGAMDGTFFEGDLPDTTRLIEAYRKALFEASETVSELGRRQDKLQSTLNQFNSGSATAEKIATKLVAVTARYNEELREQADLLRRVKGLSQSTLEESKGVKSIETRKRREDFLARQSQDELQVQKALADLDQRRGTLLDQQLGIERQVTAVVRKRTEYQSKSNKTIQLRKGAAAEVQRQVAAMRVLDKSQANIVFNTRLQLALSKQLVPAVTRATEEYNEQVAAQKRLNSLLEQGNRIRKQYADDRARKNKRSGPGLGENLALGIGFPLLFGGGAGSVIGSGLGSFVGSGFGGQILGGAIGQIIDNAVASVAELGQALNPLTADVDALVAASGQAGTELGKLLTSLDNTEQAAKDAADVLASKIGRQGVDDLRKFGDETAELGREMAILGTKIASFVAGPLAAFIAKINEGLNSPQARQIQTLDIAKADFRAGKASPEITRLFEERGSLEGSQQERTARRLEIDKEIVDILNRQNKALEDGIRLRTEGEKLAQNEKELEIQSAELIQLKRDALAASGDARLIALAAVAEEEAKAQFLLEKQELINRAIQGEISFRAVALTLQGKQVDLAETLKSIQEGLAKSLARGSSGGGGVDKEAQAQKAIASELTKQFELETKMATLNVSKLDKINIELQRLEAKRALKQAELELNTEDSRVLAAKLETLNLETNLLRQQLEIQRERAQLEEKIAGIKGRQEGDNLQRQLNQELAGLTLPTGDLFADQQQQLNVDQANRYANAIQGINDQLEIQKELAKSTIAEVSGPANVRIQQLERQKAIYQEMLPAIAQAEQQQLRFNQALSLVQGPVDAFVNGLTEGLMGLIDGTKSAEEAFADMLKGMGQALIQQAAVMIAQYIAIGIARAFAGMGGGGGGHSLPDVPKSNAVQAGWPGNLNYAEGGFVDRPTNAMIGEGSSDEYVIPSDKMASAMQRYNAGARGEAVVNGASSTEESGMMLGADAPINISTGPVMAFEGRNYVTQEEFAAGVQSAAKQGEARALRRLQMSPSARRKAGVR